MKFLKDTAELLQWCRQLKLTEVQQKAFMDEIARMEVRLRHQEDLLISVSRTMRKFEPTEYKEGI